MKKIFILIVFVTLSVSANAQLLNADFENWNISPTDTTATDWLDSGFGSHRSEVAYSGQYAIEVWNWYYYGKGYVTNSDSLSYPVIGDFETKGGFSLTTRPVSFTGYYKYIPGDNGGAIDSAVIMVSMRHRNVNGNIDTVSFSQLLLPFASTYTQFTLPINYLTLINPDSVVISFLSSKNGFCNVSGSGNCLYFTVDAIGFNTTSGLNLLDKDDKVVVYPNPASDHLTIQTPLFAEWNLNITDVQGKNMPINNYYYGNSLQIETSNFTTGIYFYCLESDNKSYKGKFIVDK